MVDQLGLDWTVPILPSQPSGSTNPGWLLGGAKGADFLVESRGLVQPRARAGVVLPGETIGLSRVDPRKIAVRYKTLGVPDRQRPLDFDRRIDRSSGR